MIKIWTDLYPQNSTPQQWTPRPGFLTGATHAYYISARDAGSSMECFVSGPTPFQRETFQLAPRESDQADLTQLRLYGNVTHVSGGRPTPTDAIYMYARIYDRYTGPTKALASCIFPAVASGTNARSFEILLVPGQIADVAATPGPAIPGGELMNYDIQIYGSKGTGVALFRVNEMHYEYTGHVVSTGTQRRTKYDSQIGVITTWGTTQSKIPTSAVSNGAVTGVYVAPPHPRNPYDPTLGHGGSG